MKAVFVAAVLLAVLGSAVAQPKKYWPSVTAAAKDNNLVAFAAAVVDNGLGPAVDNKALVATIFAPSDAAFKALADSKDPNVQALLNSKEKMVEVLKYHVVPGATLTGARIVDLIKQNNDLFPMKSLQGERVNATLVDGAVAINGVPVKAVDTQGGKVMIHTIDDVLVPPTLIPAALQASQEKKAAAVAAVPAAAAEPAAAAPADAAAAPKADAPKSSAAGLAVGAALALPAVLAALL